MGFDGFGPAENRRPTGRRADSEGVSGWLSDIDAGIRRHDRQIVSSRSAVSQGGLWRLDETQSGGDDEFVFELSPGAGLWVVDLAVTCGVSGGTLNPGAFVGAGWTDGASAFTAGPFPLRYTSGSTAGGTVPLSVQVAGSKEITVNFYDVSFDGAATPAYDFDVNAVARRIR